VRAASGRLVTDPAWSVLSPVPRVGHLLFTAARAKTWCLLIHGKASLYLSLSLYLSDSLSLCLSLSLSLGPHTQRTGTQ